VDPVRRRASHKRVRARRHRGFDVRRSRDLVRNRLGGHQVDIARDIDVAHPVAIAYRVRAAEHARVMRGKIPVQRCFGTDRRAYRRGIILRLPAECLARHGRREPFGGNRLAGFPEGEGSPRHAPRQLDRRPPQGAQPPRAAEPNSDDRLALDRLPVVLRGRADHLCLVAHRARRGRAGRSIREVIAHGPSPSDRRPPDAPPSTRTVSRAMAIQRGGGGVATRSAGGRASTRRPGIERARRR
jgi:hypothetical protein